MMKPSIDYEFLRFIDVVPETQKKIQSFYLQFFEGCRKVVDLGCGDGDFVELLSESGIEAIGVDYDERCCAAAKERNLQVVCADVFDYLQELDEASIDGIFSSHLVEHLSYERVLELLRLSYSALANGGVIVLTTPNVKAIFSHLEMFYLHFGHVSFYHPNLLRFLLEYSGFSQAMMGENPETASPLWGDGPKSFLGHGRDEFLPRGGQQIVLAAEDHVTLPEEGRILPQLKQQTAPKLEAQTLPQTEENIIPQLEEHFTAQVQEHAIPLVQQPVIPRVQEHTMPQLEEHEPISLVGYDVELPLVRKNLLRRLFRRLKMLLIRRIVKPYLDQMVAQVNQVVHQTNQAMDQLTDQTNRAISQAYQATDRTNQTVNKTNQALAQAVNETNQAISQASQALDRASQAINDTGQALDQIVSQANQAIRQANDAMIRTNSALNQVVREANEAIEQVTSQANQALKQVAGQTNQALEEVAIQTNQALEAVARQTNQTVGQTNVSLGTAMTNLAWIDEAFRGLDRPFECWAKAVKE